MSPLTATFDAITPLAAPEAKPKDRSQLEQEWIEGYRSGELSFYEVQQRLGFDNRWDTEEWLGNRGVCMNYSMEDLESDRLTLARLLGG